MDTAYELETQKFVKAWSINRDSSYIKPEEDIFIADKNQIENYNEVIKDNNLDYIEVKYKRGHLRHFIDIKENDLELLDNKIFINSWHSVIHNSSDNLADELYEKIKKYSRLLDTKIANTLYPQVGMICPVCKKGQMVERESKNKNFLGCSKYPECMQTYSIVILDGGHEE